MLSRVDVPRTALSAETQTNFIPRTLGAMSLRPGLKYLGATKDNLPTKHIPFIYSNSDTAILEATNLVLRVRVNETLVARVAVTAAVANGLFTTDLTSWIDADESAAAVSTWLAGGHMSLQGDGTSAALRTQTVVLGGADSGKEHALSIIVTRGPVRIRVGSVAGGDQYIAETELLTGAHSLAFTPTTNMFIQLLNRDDYPVLVDSCTVEAAGTLQIPTIWTTALLPKIRYTQSGDVVFVACHGVRQQRVERRGLTSWSVVDYTANDGPFRIENLTNATIAASALNGLVTLTASTPTFRASHVGGLFKLVSNGQTVTKTITAGDVFTDPILVTGAGASRAFGISVTGSWSAVVTLQRSIGAIGAWTNLTSYLITQSTSLNDALENQVVYYRVGVKGGDYTSGTVVATLTYAQGSITGIARLSAFSSSTSATAFVLKDFGSIVATKTWAEGMWSDFRGYPSTVALRGGRLYWAGKDRVWASVVDSFSSFDEAYVGDAGPISRSIGDGPVDTIRWMKSGASDLVLGADGAEVLARSNSFEDPITPFNFNLRKATTLGSAGSDAVELDTSIIFVDKSESRVIALAPEGGRYTADDLTLLASHIGLPTITNLAVQRRPDTRIHCVRSDGTVAMLISSPAEEVRAWVLVTTDGLVEEAFVLPGTEEDNVYYVVSRTVNAVTVRYLEKWALIRETVGGLVNKQADSYVLYSGAATTTITGLAHLEGRTVVVWGDGVDAGTFTVVSGAITLTTAVSNAVIGLGYIADFKSAKLVASGSALVTRQRIDHLGLIMRDTHAQGIKYGPNFDTLDDLPIVEDGADTAAGGIWSEFNNVYFEFNGEYNTDSRLCLRATAPRPCTVLAAIITMDT